MKVCVVYPSENLVREFGALFLDRCGVCLIDGEMASTAIISKDDLAVFAGDATLIPYQGYGPIHVISFEDEVRAYALIRDEASKLKKLENVKLPLNYFRPSGLLFGLLSYKIDDHHIDLSVSGSLCDMLGWQPGDLVALAQSSDKTSFILFYDRDGHALVGGQDLSVSFAISPLRDLSAFKPGSWIEVPCEVRDGCVYFRLSTDAIDRGVVDKSTDQHPGGRNPESGNEDAFPRASAFRFWDWLQMQLVTLSRLIPV